MSGDDFIDRWSRRKRAAARDEADRSAGTEPPAPAAEAPAAPPAESPPAISEEELAALPRIEDLTQGSDIRAFMRPGVPAALRNAALRKMWMLTPAIRDHKDVALDYAWDWNAAEAVPGAGGKIGAKSLSRMVEALAGQDERPAPPRAAEAGEAPDLPPGEPAEAPGTPAAPGPADEAAERPRPGRARRHGGARPEGGAT